MYKHALHVVDALAMLYDLAAGLNFLMNEGSVSCVVAVSSVFSS